MTRVLFVATKPAWPPSDGGRLLMWQTMEALAGAGHRLTFVSPIDTDERQDAESARQALRGVCTPILVPASRPHPLPALLRSLSSRRPLTIVRHASQPVRTRVDALLAQETFDVVHAEQLQALPQCAGAAARGLPVVLRAQNVESDLWTGGALARWEGARLASWEGAAVRGTAATIALTDEDAERLRALAGADAGAEVHPVAAPFPERLPAGPWLPGAPALVILSGGSWKPNHTAAAWFVSEAWPSVRAALPEARLHLFGAGPRAVDAPGVASYEAPRESATAFAAGAILVVPLRVASGVRMKILEAWARGLPVVATPTAVRGLGDAPPALVADTASEITAAIVRLQEEPSLRASLVERGRERLRARHDPAQIAARIAEVYQRAPRMGAASVRSTIDRSTAVE